MVEVEADLADGLPRLTLIGLPDVVLHESRDRIHAAVVNSGQRWPNRRITLGLFPATLPKAGSGFDLAMAVGRRGGAAGLSAPPGVHRGAGPGWPRARGQGGAAGRSQSGRRGRRARGGPGSERGRGGRWCPAPESNRP